MKFDFTYTPSKNDLKTIDKELDAFNDHALVDPDGKKIGCFLRNDTGDLLGGLIGLMLYTSLHIQVFWLSEGVRGKGYGSQLLELVLAEAAKNHIENIFLETFTFQAPEFYEKHGFIEVGRFTDYPKLGVDRGFSKTIT